MAETPRSIELSIEVVGTTQQVWEAVATGHGISSWYVPHTVEQRSGGRATASFSPGPEMEIEGLVAAWEPPHRVVFCGAEGVDNGFTFEWQVAASGEDSCTVHLISGGFGAGEEFDAMYDAMTIGWTTFLCNLKLHVQHFAGQWATPSIPTGLWSCPPDIAWRALADGLGVSSSFVVGDRIEVSTPDAPRLAGTIADATSSRVSLLVDSPAPGTAIIAAENYGDQSAVSVWLYLYGEAGADAAKRDEAIWQTWLDRQDPAPTN